MKLHLIIIYSLLTGSFLNICIDWFLHRESTDDARPRCKRRILFQYLIVEAGNVLLSVWIFIVNGMNMESILYSLMASALLVLSIIDFRTYKIPFEINLFLFCLGGLHLVRDYQNWISYVIGMVCASGFLWIINVITKGKGIGGGDIKLMAAAGLILGWKQIMLALFLGALLGSVIHLTRMILRKADHRFAFGPYLSIGIFIAALYGDKIGDNML